MADPSDYAETHTSLPDPPDGEGQTHDHFPPVAERSESGSGSPNTWPTEPLTSAGPTPASHNGSETMPPTSEDRVHRPTDSVHSGSREKTTPERALPVIPGFDILAKVGEGGMGVVYQARQLDLNRLVAIKMVVADRIDRPEDLVRFRLEAEMVARVHHPNVVQVYDSGACNGHPYLVLEWIEGGTLSKYLKKGPQPPEVGARTIELLARAIHAAHCNGVVHRDLKPSNILVEHANDANSGQTGSVVIATSTANRRDALTVTLSIDGKLVPLMPKIADFGLAKQLVGASQLTETGKVMGTPEYMSPEQADGRSDLTGPGTDVYSLGVILYQMLTGRTPFRGDSGIPLRIRVIEEEPRRPRALQPKVPRDLDTICLKCLEKHPARRYKTADDLANDLCCFLEGRPITARPTGTAERVWKWAQRRPGVAALSVAAILFFVLGFAGVTWQWRVAVAQRAQRDAMIKFLRDDWLAGATPERFRGRVLTIGDLLQSASARVAGAFPDQPEMAANVQLLLGNSYRKLGEFESADRHLSEALELRKKHLGNTHRDTLAAAADRGQLLADESKWNQAVQVLRQVVVDATKQFGANDPLTIEASGRLALVLKAQGDFVEADTLFRESLATATRVFGANDPRSLTMLNDQGLLFQARKQLPEAENAFRDAAEGRAKVLGPSHPETLESQDNLATVLEERGNWGEARPLCEKVLSEKKRVLGRGHIDTLSTMNNLAMMLNRRGELEAALVLYEEALEGFRREFGPSNSVTLTVENNLGQFAFLNGMRTSRPDLRERGETVLAAVLEMRERALPPNHPDTLQSANDLAAVYIATRRPDDALPLITKAVDGRRRIFGPGHPDTLQTVNNYALFLKDQRKQAEAIGECQDALDAAEKAGTAEHPEALKLLCTFAELLTADKQRQNDALAAAERAVALTHKVHGESHEESVRARRVLGAVLMNLNRPKDAEAHLRFVYETSLKTLGANQQRTVRDAGKLGACLLAQKRYAEAEPLLLGCYETVRDMRGVPKAQVNAFGKQLIDLYEAWGKPEKAAEWREKVK